MKGGSKRVSRIETKARWASLLACAAVVSCDPPIARTPASAWTTEDGRLVRRAECRGELVGDELNADVPVVRVRGAVTLNGRPLALQTVLGQRIEWIERGGRARFSMRFNVRTPATFDASLVPGVYDVRYSPGLGCEGSSALPCTAGLVASGLVVDRDRELSLDLRSVSAVVSFAPVGSSAQNSDLLRFRLDSEHGASALLIGSALRTEVAVWPGTYSVVFVTGDSCDPMRPWPCNNATVATGVDITESRAVRVPVETSLVDLTVAFTSSPWLLSGSGEHEVTVVGADGERSVLSRAGIDDGFRTRLVRGHYTAHYQWNSSEPCNVARAGACNQGPLGEFDATSATERVALDGEVVTLSGRVTIDGASPIGGGAGREGHVLVRRGDDTRSVRIDPDGRFSFRVMRHTRGSLSFDSGSSICEGSLPGLACGGALIADEHEFVWNEQFDVALRSHSVPVRVVIDGQRVVENSNGRSPILLTASSGGMPITLRLDSPFALRLIEGSYVATGFSFAPGRDCSRAGTVPCGTNVLASSLSVRSDDELVVDVRTRRLFGQVMFNGLWLPLEPWPSVSFFARQGPENSVDLFATSPLSYEQRVLDQPLVGVIRREGVCVLGAMEPRAFCGTYWFAGCP